jgi:hypothetical protein
MDDFISDFIQKLEDYDQRKRLSLGAEVDELTGCRRAGTEAVVAAMMPPTHFRSSLRVEQFIAPIGTRASTYSTGKPDRIENVGVRADAVCSTSILGPAHLPEALIPNVQSLPTGGSQQGFPDSPSSQQSLSHQLNTPSPAEGELSPTTTPDSLSTPKSSSRYDIGQASPIIPYLFRPRTPETPDIRNRSLKRLRSTIDANPNSKKRVKAMMKEKQVI